MSSYSDYDSISFCGYVTKTDSSLNKLRLCKSYYNGFFTLIPPKIDVNSKGIFIPSLCSVTKSTIDLIKKIYGHSSLRLLDRDFLMYVADDGVHFEGIWLPIQNVCDHFKIDIEKFNDKVELNLLKELGIISSLDYFDRIYGKNDLRFINIEEQQFQIHELIHGDVFKLYPSRFLKKIKISNNSIDKKDFVGLNLLGSEIYLVKPRINSGPVNFHVKNTVSKSKYGKYLIFSYENSKKYYLKMVVNNNINLPYKELIEMSCDKFEMPPEIFSAVLNKDDLITLSEGRVKTKSLLGNHIMKGYEIYGKDGKPYTYLSPLYLASCSESTIWS